MCGGIENLVLRILGLVDDEEVSGGFVIVWKRR